MENSVDDKILHDVMSRSLPFIMMCLSEYLG